MRNFEVRKLILQHIEDLDQEILRHGSNAAVRAELFKAKSLAYQSLVKVTVA